MENKKYDLKDMENVYRFCYYYGYEGKDIETLKDLLKVTSEGNEYEEIEVYQTQDLIRAESILSLSKLGILEINSNKLQEEVIKNG